MTKLPIIAQRTSSAPVFCPECRKGWKPAAVNMNTNRDCWRCSRWTWWFSSRLCETFLCRWMILKDAECVLLTWLRAFFDLLLRNESARCSLLMLLLFVIDPLKSVRGFSAFRPGRKEARWAPFTSHQSCTLTGTTPPQRWDRRSPLLRENSQ